VPCAECGSGEGRGAGGGVRDTELDGGWRGVQDQEGDDYSGGD